VISPTFRRYIERAHYDGRLCIQVEPLIGIVQNPLVDMASFEDHLQIAHAWQDAPVCWNNNLTYRGAIASAVLRYSEVVDCYPSTAIIHAVNPLGVELAHPCRTAEEFLKGLAAKYIHMAILGPNSTGTPQGLNSLSAMRTLRPTHPLYGVFENVVQPAVRFFVTYLNPRAKLEQPMVEAVKVNHFASNWKKRLKLGGFWSNEYADYRRVTGFLVPGDEQMLRGIMYEYALHLARMFPSILQNSNRACWFVLDWQKTNYVIVDNYRYQMFYNPFPHQPRDYEGL
jgi:hypothetical protein